MLLTQAHEYYRKALPLQRKFQRVSCPRLKDTLDAALRQKHSLLSEDEYACGRQVERVSYPQMLRQLRQEGYVMDSASLRRSVWISSLITFVGLMLYIGIAAGLGTLWSPGSGIGFGILGVFLALAPALVWMVFFLERDRVEAEPKQLILRTFAFGALGAALATILERPFVEETIPQLPNLIIRIVATVLTVSLLQETLKVAMVRYTVLVTNEFDRHPDGIVYGLAAGLGFATVITLDFVLQSAGTVEPLRLAIRAVNNVLVHGALGAVSGYYIGRVKIDGKKLGWMANGLAIVTALNALYHIATDELSSRFTFNPWYSLLIAFGLAIVVGVVLFAFFRRALLRASGELSTISMQVHARSLRIPWDIHLRYDLLLVGALIVAMAVGWGAGWWVDARHLTYSGEELSVSFQYPSGWGIQSEMADDVVLRNPFAPGAFKPTLRVSETKATAGVPLDFTVAERVTSYEQTLLLFEETGRYITMVGEYEAIQIEYRYASSTSSGPAVVQGIETYVLIDTQLYIFRYEAQPDSFESNLGHYNWLLQSAHFEEGE
jgi:RsiW-degrading membrane proteinase PrsW (M82 family)